MMTWLISIFTWKLKLGLAIALVVAAGWYFEHEKTKAYERGVAAGQEKLFKDQARQLEEKSAAERAQLAHDRSELADAGKKLEAQRSALTAERRAAAAELDHSLDALSKKDIDIRNEVTHTPDADLLPRVRAALAAVRQAESSRPAR
jgi:hypothetical protein